MYLQCYTAAPNINFEPGEILQAVGNFWRLEGWRTLPDEAGIILCKQIDGLKLKSIIKACVTKLIRFLFTLTNCIAKVNVTFLRQIVNSNLFIHFQDRHPTGVVS